MIQKRGKESMKKDFSKMRDLDWTDEEYFNDYEEERIQKIKPKKPSTKGEYNNYDSKKKKKK